MKKLFAICLFAATNLTLFSCVPEIPSITPANAQGNYHEDLSALKGATVGFFDCSNNELFLNDGDLLVSYNVVSNSNTTNANAHVLLSNLTFTTSDPNISYHGNLDVKLNSHVAKGEAVTFATSFQLEGKGTANKVSVAVKIHTVSNANGTLTVDNIKLTPGCSL